MMVVVLLLHLNCFAQYALCGLNLGFRRSERPPVGVGICVSFAIAAPAAAGLYTILSPLGKEYGDVENPVDSKVSLERRYSFASRDDESDLEWRGGVLDIWEDIKVSYLSLLCTFCVFGWNMERIGFGNMYVHIATLFSSVWLLSLYSTWLLSTSTTRWLEKGLVIWGSCFACLVCYTVGFGGFR